MDKIAHYKKEIEKTAKLNADVKLYDHQQRVVNDPHTSQIIAHSVGSGKTLTAIAKFEKMKTDGRAKKALVIVPAGLRDNFGHSGVKKFTDSKYNIIGTKSEMSSKKHGGINPNADYNIISYEMFKKDPTRYIKESGADTVIADESHRGKNEDTQLTQSLKKARKLYANHIALTGSIISNTPADIQPLMDVVTGGKHNLGKTKDEFEKKWVLRNNSRKYSDVHEKRRPIKGFRNSKQLKKELAGVVDYADFKDIKDTAKMPDKELSVTKVPMTRAQAKTYKKIVNGDPKLKQLIRMKRLETLKDDEAANAFSRLFESRKLMNSIGSVTPGMTLSESAENTPKTRKLLDDLNEHLSKTPKGRAILFSHLINGGTDVLEAGLKKRGIKYGTFTGKGNKGVTEESRQQSVTDYNAGKNKVMVVSSAGGEGLSLNDTTWEGVLDPHYNPEKMNQMEARGIRSGGLSYLPKSQRKVRVKRYLSTMPRTLGIFKSSYRTPDELIHEIAHNKNNQNQHLHDLLKTIRAKHSGNYDSSLG